MNSGKHSGSTFGPYELIAPLGSGGMGEVYRARDNRLKRDVAIKLLSADVPEESERHQRFLQEARAASALNHPNILSVFDVGKENGTQFIVSELIEGESLRVLIGKGPMPLKRYLDIAIQIAAGLTAAHEAGIIHRDLKPENIMITRDNRVKILDFGLAKPVLPGDNTAQNKMHSQLLTQPGVILGTVSYMSPEQARGEGIDFRSDQFSFGLVLYEMATGKKAFYRDTPVQTLSAIISEDPPSVSSLNPRFPAPLRWLIERCLAKDMRERYGATIDLYHELRDFREHLSETSWSGESVAAKPAPHHQIKKVLPVILLSLLSLIAGYIIANRMQKPAEQRMYTFTPLANNDVNEICPSWSPDGKSVAYMAEINGIYQIFTRSLTASLPVQITFSETDCLFPVWFPDSSRIYYTQKRKDGSQQDVWAISAAGGTPSMLVENAEISSMSPDGKTIAFFRPDESTGVSLWISSPIGAKPVKYTQEPFLTKKLFKGDLMFSPDGSKIFVQVHSIEPQKSSQIWIVPFPSGKPKLLEKISNRDFYGYSWAPDSKHAVAAIYDGNSRRRHLWVINTETEISWPITNGILDEGVPAVSPDGRRIAFGTGTVQFDMVEIPLDGSPMRDLTATPLNEKAPAWSPDGSQFAYVSDRNGKDIIFIRNQSEQVERALITEKDFPDQQILSFSRPMFSPDGRRIAYHVNTQNGTQIWISNLGGGSPIPLFREENHQFAPAWSMDGNWIAYIRKTGVSYSLAKIRVGGSEVPKVLNQNVIYYQPQFSPDGSGLLYQTEEGVFVSSIDGSNPKRISRSEWYTGGWSADGSLLYAVRETDARRLVLSAYNRNGEEKIITDLAPAPLTFTDSPFAGFSLSPDGKSIATSIHRSKIDLWILENFAIP